MHADMVMHEQAIGIDDDGRAISRDPSGADPVSVDTCAVLRDPHPPASSPADLARLMCQQDAGGRKGTQTSHNPLPF